MAETTFRRNLRDGEWVMHAELGAGMVTRDSDGETARVAFECNQNGGATEVPVCELRRPTADERALGELWDDG